MKTRLCIAGILLALLQPAHAGRYALLVGNSMSEGNSSRLKHVQNDLNAVKEILGDFCGFDRQRITTLYNGTPDDLQLSLHAIAGRMAGGKDDMFLLYYSGHAEATGLKMGGSDFPLDSLKKKFTSFPSAIRIGIFDACQSGLFTRIKGGRLEEPFLFRDDSKAEGQVILCSSSASENAQESDVLGNSIFTFYFVNALRGSGDLSNDGRVTLSEAYQYAYNHTISNTAGSSGGVQHPSYQFHIHGEGDIVLADLNTSSRGILLGPDVTGDITVLSSANAVVADLVKEKNSAIKIALSPGSYRVLNAREGRRFQAAVTVNDGSVTSIRHTDFSALQAGDGRRKGEPQSNLRVGLTLGGGCGFYDLSRLASGLDERFSGCSSLSMDPRFTLPVYTFPLFFEIEVLKNGRFSGSLGFGKLRHSGAGDYGGTSTSPADGAVYGAKLHVDYSVDAFVTNLCAGYRFQRGHMNNFSVHAGAAFFSVTTKVSSRFYDSLYDVESSGNGTNRALAAVPYAALRYTRPFADWIDAGAVIRYRFQVSPVTGSDGNDADDDNTVPLSSAPPKTEAPLRYDFGGMDGGVFITLHLTRSILEKL
ncbi:MAG: caspase family protein [Chitinispirillaceae bacterium]|nr:caspase family protein [Chitinispirillaceae bacterium]